MRTASAIAAAAALLALPGTAPAPIGTNIFDRWTDDLNVITNCQVVNEQTSIWEDYNEDNLVVYPSHDGYAVVDHDGGEVLRWFDKIWRVYGGFDSYILEVNATNTTPFAWSDFHFEFYTADFSQQLMLVVTEASCHPFEHSETGAGYVNFWTEGSGLATGQTGVFTIALGPGEFDENGDIGIRQIATTVPVPATMGLIALGGLGVLLRRRRR